MLWLLCCAIKDAHNDRTGQTLLQWVLWLLCCAIKDAYRKVVQLSALPELLSPPPEPIARWEREVREILAQLGMEEVDAGDTDLNRHD